MSEQPESNSTGDSISLANEEAVKKVLQNAILGLWEVVNDLTRLRPSRRDRYRVTIFGSARAVPGSARLRGDQACRGRTGQAGLRHHYRRRSGPDAGGQRRCGGASDLVQSVGIRVELPFEQNANAFVGQAFEHRTFFTRLHQFVLTSDAYIVAPGGVGTVLETMMIWQLLQVRHLHDTPLILVGRMWPGLVEWARTMMLSFEPPLANAADFAIPQCVAHADEAIAVIREHYSKWSEVKQ